MLLVISFQGGDSLYSCILNVHVLCSDDPELDYLLVCPSPVPR